MIIDPEYQRYKRSYPTFPGVATCVDLLHRNNVKGGYLECVLWDLESNVLEHLDELIAAIYDESNEWVQNVLLSCLAKARSEAATAVFSHFLTHANESIRHSAAVGLHFINSKESRRILWEARSIEFVNAETTARFGQMLDEVKRYK